MRCATASLPRSTRWALYSTKAMWRGSYAALFVLKVALTISFIDHRQYGLSVLRLLRLNSQAMRWLLRSHNRVA
jgi:hypothetical protein